MAKPKYSDQSGPLPLGHISPDQAEYLDCELPPRNTPGPPDYGDGVAPIHPSKDPRKPIFGSDE